MQIVERGYRRGVKRGCGEQVDKNYRMEVVKGVSHIGGVVL